MTDAVIEKLDTREKPSPPKPANGKKYPVKRELFWGRTIAIRINEDSIEFATARKLGYSSSLIDISRVDFTPVGDKNLVMDSINTEIDAYIKKFGGRFTKIIVGVGGSNTALRFITLPDIPNKEIPAAVYWEAKKRIPYAVEDSYLGFQKIESVNTDEGGKLSVSLLAISKEDVDDCLWYLNDWKDQVAGINNDLEALGYLLPYIPEYNADNSYALINIRKRSTEISFYHGSRLEFMHVCNIGYQGINIDELSEEVNRPFIEALINEIQNSLDYYLGQFSVSLAEKVYVYGDLCFSSDLLLTMTNRFGIAFQCFPFNNLLKANPKARKFPEQVPVSLGVIALALNNHKLIDFLPADIRETVNSQRFQRLGITGLTILTLALMSYWGIVWNQNKIKVERLQNLQEQNQHIQSSPMITMYNKIRSQMAAEQAILNHLSSSPTHLNLNLKELSRLAPREMELLQFDLTKSDTHNVLSLVGRIDAVNPPPEVILAEFVASMESSPLYDNIRVNKHTKKTADDRFVIDFQISADAVL